MAANVLSSSKLVDLFPRHFLGVDVFAAFRCFDGLNCHVEELIVDCRHVGCRHHVQRHQSSDVGLELSNFTLVSSKIRQRPDLASGTNQARTGRGIHGLPKVSCGPAMPDPYTPCKQATPQMFGGGLPARRAACGRLLPPWIPLPVWAWWD
jgi:hypothetical protein